jgi:hypothetical protein
LFKVVGVEIVERLEAEVMVVWDATFEVEMVLEVEVGMELLGLGLPVPTLTQ